MTEIKTTINIHNLNIEVDKEAILEEINNLPESDWYFVKFHGGWICGLYNDRKEGQGGWFPRGFNPNLPKDGAVVRAIRDSVFPYVGGTGNITIIRTPPNQGLNDHLDSTPEEMGTDKPKFRWVLKGKLETMYFFDKDYNKVPFTPTSDKYIVNGAHPHGMYNSGKETKFTMCLGHPWQDNEIFRSNVESQDAQVVSFPEKVLDKWVDQRFVHGKVGLGITEDQKISKK